MVTIAFRVDASLSIGSGHVMRCLTLAEELKKYGNSVVFVMRPQPGDLCEYVLSRGFRVERLPQTKNCVIPKNTADYEAWLQVPLLEDAESFLSITADSNLVIIDHYGITAEWEALIKSRTSCKLVAIDDLVREHNADLIIDQTVGREACEYQKTSKDSHVLTGSKYALLKEEFSSCTRLQ